MQPSFEQFVYEPIDYSADSIRLIELDSGADSAPIRCTMRYVNMIDADYTCLSYARQPSHPHHEIEIMGLHFLSTEIFSSSFVHTVDASRELPHLIKV